MRYDLVLPELGAGRKVINLPRTHAIHELTLTGNFGGTPVDPTIDQWATYVTRIEVLVDGHAVWNISMTNYVAWLKRHGMTTQAGVLPIFFARPWEDFLELRRHAILGTADLQSLQLALTFASGVTINSFALSVLGGANERIGQFVGFTERPVTISAAGTHDIEDLPSGMDYATMAVHFDFDTIEEIKVYIGSTEVDTTSKDVRLNDDKRNGRTAQSGYTHLDFSRSGDIREVFPMQSRGVRLRITTSDAPGQKTMLHEYVQDFSRHRRALA